VSSTDNRQRRIPAVAAAPRPLFTKPSYLLLVLAGGAIGTTVRYGLESRFGVPVGQWPWVTFGINVAGSFLLGVLLATLAGTGADQGWRRRVRLTVGTGVMGGFTTYSTFILEVDQLAHAGSTATATAYAVTSVVLGIAAALAGVLLGRRAARMLTARVEAAS